LGPGTNLLNLFCAGIKKECHTVRCASNTIGFSLVAKYHSSPSPVLALNHTGCRKLILTSMIGPSKARIRYPALAPGNQWNFVEHGKKEETASRSKITESILSPENREKHCLPRKSRLTDFQFPGSHSSPGQLSIHVNGKTDCTRA